ncbi:MAG: type IV secretion system DNA-binding domain-containing protein [Candidatus Liptonbacteria bacterium]|nr:type IV secretion system DNA-binding domain-containing protein [Candidatus Liptonbacteria bacterium]
MGISVLTIVIVIAAALLAVPAGLYFYRAARRRVLFENLQMRLIGVQIASSVAGEANNFKEEINKSDQLFASLLSLGIPVVFEAAVPVVGSQIRFFVAAARKNIPAVAQQILGIWNDARVEEVDDYTVFHPQGAVAGAFMRLDQPHALPIRTYEEIGNDTFSQILSGLAKVNEVGEGAAVQVVMRPAARADAKQVLEAVKKLRRGERVDGRSGPSPFITPADVHRALFGGTNERVEDETRERVMDEERIAATQQKLARPLVEVTVRLIASAPTQYQADGILENLAAGFSQFGAPNRNAFKIRKPSALPAFIYDFTFRRFAAAHRMVLNTKELASIFHLPTPFNEVPRIQWLKAKDAPPPATLPSDGTMIGNSVFRGEVRPVRIADEDRRRHVYIIGQTGTGKSTLLSSMIVDDIRRGKGVGIIDPHGDLVESILGLIPSERERDVIVFNPADYWRPLGLNMIEYDPARPEEKTFIVNEMQGIFNRLFSAETMGPMFEQYMRNALLLLMEDAPAEPATLIEVPRAFTDAEFRKRKLARITNPTVLDFWEKEAVKAGGEASLANITPYITSKFNVFIANDYIRPIIGQTRSAFRLADIMDEGKILLVNLSKGKIGDINAGLLGMIITGKVLMAALAREQGRRRDFNLYIDEFQNFTTDSIGSILSEARKYGLNLTMAHQFIAQLTEPIRDAVFGNVGSIAAFRVGVQDAEFLEKEFAPVFGVNDLINIDNFNAYAKLLINGQTSKPFNIRTLPLDQGEPVAADRIAARSRELYGADRDTVEKEIYNRLRL